MLVTCAIIFNENKILATQRSEKMHLPFKWEFPGGKVKENESETECIIREIKEELNIEILPIKRLEPVVHRYELEISLIPYLSKYLNGQIHLAEHNAYTWLPLNELLTLDWAAADLNVVHQILNIKL